MTQTNISCLIVCTAEAPTGIQDSMWRVALSDLNFDNRESEAVQQVLDSGWLTMGPRTAEFEEAFARKHQVPHAIAVTNCTCALELVFQHVLSTSPKDRKAVIVPDITFVATANAVLAAGGHPVLCDVDSDSRPFLSAERLEQLLSTRGDVAAVALVHYAGYDAGSEAVAAICNRHNVVMIEDCAHSPGALTNTGRSLGTIGFAGCFSFFSNKNMATGEGGMIITADAAFASWAKMARSHGMSTGTWSRHTQHKTSYDVNFPGHNYRCTEITAALGLVQLDKLDQANQRRRALTRLYKEAFRNTSLLTVSPLAHCSVDFAACHILPLLAPNKLACDQVREALSRSGIQTSHHYTPVHEFTWYEQRAQQQQTYPNATAFASRELTLPLHPGLKPEQVDEIASIAIRAVS